MGDAVKGSRILTRSGSSRKAGSGSIIDCLLDWYEMMPFEKGGGFKDEHGIRGRYLGGNLL